MKKTITIVISLVLLLAMLGGCTQKGFDNKTAITVIAREEGSGTRGAFIELFKIEKKDANGKRSRDFYCRHQLQYGVVLTTVAQNKYAIGYVSLGSLNDTVKALQIDGVAATVANIKNGTYKVSRPFNIATKDGLSDVAKDFIDYILSKEGQAGV